MQTYAGPDGRRYTIRGDDADEMVLGAWLTRLTGRLVAELRDGGIAQPLAEPLMLGCVLHDLFTLAGITPPADVRKVIEA